jgi:cytochrome P450
VTAPLDELVELEHPDFYDDEQFTAYERMRAQAPAYYYPPLDLFALTRMDDIRWVSTNPGLFTSTRGLTLNQLRLAELGSATAFERFNDRDGEFVINLDPPRQRELRALMSPTLTPRYLQTFMADLRQFCAELVAGLPEGVQIDFVSDVAADLPLMVAAAILGVERPDLARMKRWVWALEELTRVESIDELETAGQQFDEMKVFLREQIERKQKAPGQDMISSFLGSTLDGGAVPAATVLSHVSTLMSNGGTTRLLMASIAHHFATHPEHVTLSRDDPAVLDAVIEECLRLTPPARGFVRTATTEVDLHGATIREGQRVYLLYPAANRDPAVFDAPDVFRLDRDSAQHAAFGFGTHFCLGAALARMEAKELFTQLLGRFDRIELAGAPQRYRHVQLNGLASLPLAFHTAGAGERAAAAWAGIGGGAS